MVANISFRKGGSFKSAAMRISLLCVRIKNKMVKIADMRFAQKISSHKSTFGTISPITSQTLNSTSLPHF